MKKVTKYQPAQEEKGIEAIIFLQSMAGITESREKALRGWRGMSDHEREFTLDFYQKMKSQEE